MRLAFFPRRVIEQLVPEKNWALISIGDPGEPVDLRNGWKKTMRIDCHDLCPGTGWMMARKNEETGREEFYAEYFDEEDPLDVEASIYKLNYINLDGTVGNMVNGAGLAMAVMDTIKLAGAEPANFLDVGGGATAERVAEAFKLILSDSNVKAVLVNIFGGIVRCDLIAEGIIAAVTEVGISVPVVVRLEGTNAQAGLEMLNHSGLNLDTADDLTAAAQKVVALAAG